MHNFNFHTPMKIFYLFIYLFYLLFFFFFQCEAHAIILTKMSLQKP